MVILLAGVDILAAGAATLLCGVILFAAEPCVDELLILLAALAIGGLFALVTALVTLLVLEAGFLAILALVALLALFLGAVLPFSVEDLADLGAAFLGEAVAFFAVVVLLAEVILWDDADAFLDFDDFLAVEVSNSIGIVLADLALSTASSAFLRISFDTIANALSKI
ncbi:hypothetical protein clem_11805 [Legionella clemsonensis]|uniref:Uncharacterized protein n=1 Tax=Legionella clemsonensis TaxID=1867846 RepID=A0A222P4X6_9GAMM|nr:hypothetical protein clem_11805 [Legionella clemsonensis]